MWWQMNGSLTVLVIAAAWIMLSVILALVIGRAISIADFKQRQLNVGHTAPHSPDQARRAEVPPDAALLED